MKTHEHITAALAEVERFQSNAMGCWEVGGSEGFVTAIHIGWEISAEPYLSAIRHLDAALALVNLFPVGRNRRERGCEDDHRRRHH